VLDRLDRDREGALARLFELLRIPSISTDPAHAADCRRAADRLAADLSSMGFEARVIETEGLPIVRGDAEGAGPHLLFYGHYDVQPVDPLSLWDHDPFDPFVETRGDGTRAIRGRGAADDKGQLMTFLEACRAWRAATGALPCRLTVLFEGEEESTGESLRTYLEREGAGIGADLVLVCDTGMWNRTTPAITTSLRGICTEEVTVRAADRDLHSGFFGNAAANPNHVLAAALAGLRDGAGRVTLEGFHDGVPEVPDAIRRQWQSLDFDPAAFLGQVGLSVPAGEAERSVLEQVWARPTAEVNGMWGGYTGAGFKTVIPAEAHAKVSFRLVGEQDPERVRAAFREHMAAAMPPDCRAEHVSHGGARAISMPTDAPAFEAARRSLSEEWGVEAPFIGRAARSRSWATSSASSASTAC
jgi:acetylornithine deacetylase/succinyl-diaminopimelate desuccinylase-like protein